MSYISEFLIQAFISTVYSLYTLKIVQRRSEQQDSPQILRIFFELQHTQMNYNYHKRLVTNYVSEPKYGVHKMNSQHAYITAANSKYYNNPRMNTYQDGYNQLGSVPYCQQCLQETSRKRKQCNHLPRNTSGASQYFTPEIKTIRNALLDIRDQMKNKGRNTQRLYQDNTKRQYQAKLETQNQLNQYYKQFETKYFEKDKQLRALEIKNQELNHIVSELERKNKHFQQDIKILEQKINAYESEIQQRRNRVNRLQFQKNQSLQRQRDLQVRMMNLRAELMSKQQLLRQINLNESQMRQRQMQKKMMMGPSEEISMIVWNKQGSRQNRSTQTNLTQVDIENGFKELNTMQDNLCEKINGNLKIEKKIFSRIAEVDDRLSKAYEKLFRVQQQASQLGINIQSMSP